MKHSAIFHFSFFISHLALLAGLVMLLGRSSSLPQVASGDNVLSVIFGDAREVISRSAVIKANNYFHGGVEIDCHGIHAHNHDHDHEHEHEHCHDEHCDHDHDHDHGGCHDASCPFCHHDHDDHDHAAEENSEEKSETLHSSLFTLHFSFDPWDWINVRVRAPEVDRHIEDDKSVELMPWLWAAVKADPHNADAWSTAWYIARCAIKDKELARRIVSEARAKNPDSIEIAFTEGRDLYDFGKGDLAAAVEAFKRARALGDAKCGGDVSKLSEKEGETYRFAANYLKELEKKLNR